MLWFLVSRSIRQKNYTAFKKDNVLDSCNGFKNLGKSLLHRFRNAKVKIDFMSNNPFVTDPRSLFHHNAFLEDLEHIGMKCLVTNSNANNANAKGIRHLNGFLSVNLGVRVTYLIVYLCVSWKCYCENNLTFFQI